MRDLGLGLKSKKRKTIKWVAFAFSLVFLGLTFAFLFFTSAKADINSDCQNEDPAQLVQEGKVDQCTQILSGIASSIGAANATNQKNLAALQSQLDNLNNRIEALSNQLKETVSNISKQEESLGFTQAVLDQKTRDHYTFLRLYDPIAPFLFADSATQVFEELSLRQKENYEWAYWACRSNCSHIRNKTDRLFNWHSRYPKFCIIILDSGWD